MALLLRYVSGGDGTLNHDVIKLEYSCRITRETT